MGIVLSFFRSLFGWSDTNENKAKKLNNVNLIEPIFTGWLPENEEKAEKEAEQKMKKQFPITKQNIEVLNATEKSKHAKNVQKIKTLLRNQKTAKKSAKKSAKK